MYYIGIDLGTSAVKLLLMQGDGQIAETANALGQAIVDALLEVFDGLLPED